MSLCCSAQPEPADPHVVEVRHEIEWSSDSRWWRSSALLRDDQAQEKAMANEKCRRERRGVSSVGGLSKTEDKGGPLNGGVGEGDGICGTKLCPTAP
jgi:hypothetical protein